MYMPDIKSPGTAATPAWSMAVHWLEMVTSYSNSLKQQFHNERGLLRRIQSKKASFCYRFILSGSLACNRNCVAGTAHWLQRWYSLVHGRQRREGGMWFGLIPVGNGVVIIGPDIPMAMLDGCLEA